MGRSICPAVWLSNILSVCIGSVINIGNITYTIILMVYFKSYYNLFDISWVRVTGLGGKGYSIIPAKTGGSHRPCSYPGKWSLFPTRVWDSPITSSTWSYNIAALLNHTSTRWIYYVYVIQVLEMMMSWIFNLSKKCDRIGTKVTIKKHPKHIMK